MDDRAWQSLIHPEGALFFYETHKVVACWFSLPNINIL